MFCVIPDTKKMAAETWKYGTHVLGPCVRSNSAPRLHILLQSHLVPDVNEDLFLVTGLWALCVGSFKQWSKW
jgi:hypothetical protein